MSPDEKRMTRLERAYGKLIASGDREQLAKIARLRRRAEAALDRREASPSPRNTAAATKAVLALAVAVIAEGEP